MRVKEGGADPVEAVTRRRVRPGPGVEVAFTGRPVRGVGFLCRGGERGEAASGIAAAARGRKWRQGIRQPF